MRFAIAFFSIIFIAALVINPLSARTSKNGDNPGKAIPESVMKIAQKSCVKCHTAPAKGISICLLNLTNWDKLSPGKQAAKAKKMCNWVTIGKMPPRKFRANNPDGVPSKEEVATICNWATSLRRVKK